MVSSTRQRSSKRPREYHDVELNERVRKRFKKLEEENRELREAMDDLKGLVECPVCLNLPRQGSPMPVCSNGHFVCLACRDQIRQAAGLEEAKCPSCMVVLGNATSVLASRVIQRATHECEHDGCEEKIPFAHLEKHRLACLFRKVLCPGCRIEKTVQEVAQHVQFCEGATECDVEADKTIRRGFTYKDGHVEVKGSRESKVGYVNIEKRGFFVQEKREGNFFFSEIIMLGSEEDCRRFLITMKIRDKDGKEFSTKCHPRLISMERWGNVGLWVHNDALSSLSKMDDKEDEVEFDIEISFEKLNEDEDKDQDENRDNGDESQDEVKSESEDEEQGEDENEDRDELQDDNKGEDEDKSESEDGDQDGDESEDEYISERGDEDKNDDEDRYDDGSEDEYNYDAESEDEYKYDNESEDDDEYQEEDEDKKLTTQNIFKRHELKEDNKAEDEDKSESEDEDQDGDESEVEDISDRLERMKKNREMF